MKIKDLLERSGVQLLSGGCGEEEITALTYDSRKAQTGSLFFCLRGARSNGEDFAPAAYAQGCRCFVSEGTLDVPEDADVVRVSDARQAYTSIVPSAGFYDSRGSVQCYGFLFHQDGSDRLESYPEIDVLPVADSALYASAVVGTRSDGSVLGDEDIILFTSPLAYSGKPSSVFESFYGIDAQHGTS